MNDVFREMKLHNKCYNVARVVPNRELGDERDEFKLGTNL
jgi:hypothetical protein